MVRVAKHAEATVFPPATCKRLSRNLVLPRGKGRKCLASEKTKMTYEVQPGIRRGVTDLYPSRGYTYSVTRGRKYHTQLSNLTFDQKPFLVDLTAEVCFFIF